MDYEEIVYTLEDHVATIRLNRPEAMNALTYRTYAELTDALKASDADPEARVVIITGTGRAFCSGDDVRQVMADPKAQEERRRRITVKGELTPAAAALLGHSKPLIAQVNGPAVGWGCDLALLCDIRIASETAKFAELFIRRGLIADVGGTYRLPLIVGLAKAYELLFTGDVIDAWEALRIGLVSRLAPPEELGAAVGELAGKIAQNPPLAMRFMKEAVRKGLDARLAEIGEFNAYAYSVLFQTEDHKEGARAFLEKREPVFHGR